MPEQDQDNTTLGQRIDALIGPLDAEAQQYRDAIRLGREQLEQMQQKIGMAETALGEIEEQMIRVLRAMAAEDPVLALAMGGGLDGAEVPPPATPPIGPTPMPTPEEDAEAVGEILGMLGEAEAGDGDTIEGAAGGSETGDAEATPAEAVGAGPLAAAADEAEEIARMLDETSA